MALGVQMSSPRDAAVQSRIRDDGSAGDGRPVDAALVESGGFLYSTTTSGGASDRGVVYRLSLASALTIVSSFEGASLPTSRTTLVDGLDGFL